MRYLKELHEGEHISEIYFCKTKVVAKSKTDKTYYSLTLQDKTGTIDAKVARKKRPLSFIWAV